jgi:hypothetical protein
MDTTSTDLFVFLAHSFVRSFALSNTTTMYHRIREKGVFPTLTKKEVGIWSGMLERDTLDVDALYPMDIESLMMHCFKKRFKKVMTVSA